jgi:hypothetical protein
MRLIEPVGSLKSRFIRGSTPRNVAWVHTLLISTAGALLFWSMITYLPRIEEVWAFDFWFYLSVPLKGLLAVVFGLLLWLPLHLHQPDFLQRFEKLPVWPLALPSGLIFWLFREQTFAGDALLSLLLLDEKSVRTDPYVWKEPLDALFAHTATDLLRPQGLDAADAVALLSVLAGMVYVSAALWIARLLFRTTGARLLLFLGLMALGSSQLWFGHVENYSLVTAFAYLSVAAALAYQRGRLPLWVVGLAGGTAVSFHPQAAFTLPALLLLLERSRWPRQVLVLAVSSAVVPLLTVATLLSIGVPLPDLDGGYAGDPQLFWTPAQALAPAQLWDSFMNLWLLMPALPILFPIALWGWTQPNLRQDRTFHYLSALAGGLLLYHFSFQNDLPRPQDWDLYAIAGPGVALLGYWVLGETRRRRGEEAKEPGIVELRNCGCADPRIRASRFTFHALRITHHALLLFSLLFSAAWIGVNHSYTLLRPDPAWQFLYERYRLVDIQELLPVAQVLPEEPICDDPATDPTGCQRVKLTTFNMPQSGDVRQVIFAHAPARVVLPLDLPPTRTFLWLSPALDPMAWGWGGDGVTFRLLVQHNGVESLLAEQYLSPQNAQDLDWQELFVSLEAYAGQSVQVILETAPGPAGDASADRAGWGTGWLMQGTVRR